MKNNKSPGLDEIPVQFYKLFLNEIKTYFYDALMKSFTVEELSITRRISVINLITQKGDRDKV